MAARNPASAGSIKPLANKIAVSSIAEPPPSADTSNALTLPAQSSEMMSSGSSDFVVFAIVRRALLRTASGCCDGRCSVELAAEFGNIVGAPPGRKKSRAISDSIASILAAVSSASVRCKSLSASVLVVAGPCAPRAIVDDGLRLTGPGSGRADWLGRRGGREPAFTAVPASLDSFLKKENATTFYRYPICTRARRFFGCANSHTRFWHQQPPCHLAKGPETSNPFRRGRIAFNGATVDAVALDTVFE